jgi:hypothetical protein
MKRAAPESCPCLSPLEHRLSEDLVSDTYAAAVRVQLRRNHPLLEFEIACAQHPVAAQVVVHTATIRKYSCVAVKEATASQADEKLTIRSESPEIVNVHLRSDEVSAFSDANVLVEVQPVALSFNADIAVDSVVNKCSDADERVGTGLRDSITCVIGLEDRSETACDQFGLMCVCGLHNLRVNGRSNGCNHHAKKENGRSVLRHERSISGECQLRLGCGRGKEVASGTTRSLISSARDS